MIWSTVSANRCTLWHRTTVQNVTQSIFLSNSKKQKIWHKNISQRSRQNSWQPTSPYFSRGGGDRGACIKDNSSNFRQNISLAENIMSLLPFLSLYDTMFTLSNSCIQCCNLSLYSGYFCNVACNGLCTVAEVDGYTVQFYWCLHCCIAHNFNFAFCIQAWYIHVLYHIIYNLAF